MKSLALFLALLSLAACNTSVAPDPDKISALPAAASHMNLARQAAKACGTHAPDYIATATTLKKLGFRSAQDPRLASIDARFPGNIYEAQGGAVVVQLGSVGRENGCLVGAKGMTPEQAYDLALPWVEKFGALTNAERGQGLSKKAVQAWGSLTEDRIVYIAAYKAWDLLDTPGAMARLIYIVKE